MAGSCGPTNFRRAPARAPAPLGLKCAPPEVPSPRESVHAHHGPWFAAAVFPARPRPLGVVRRSVCAGAAIPCDASMTQSHELAAWGTIAVLLLTGCIGVGLAWIGRGYWLASRTTQDGVAATAVIDRLDYTGPYLVGRFFALVSFRDVAGIERVGRIALPNLQWNRLREGRAVDILYSATDPGHVTLGGKRMRALTEAAGAIFVALGLLIVLAVAWILVAGP